jgi:hypothetical protein
MGLVTYFGMEGLGPRWVEPSRGSSPLSVGLTRCRSDHVAHACSHGKVLKPGTDGSTHSTRVPFCQGCMGVYGYVLSCQALGGASYQGPSYGACPVLDSPWARLLRGA